jgi:hypothetical protein
MRILFLTLIPVLTILAVSCSKDEANEYQPPLIADSVVQRAHSFTFKKWKDAGQVSLHDNDLIWDVILDSSKVDSVHFRATQANPAAREANNKIFYDQHPEVRYRVHMRFNYVLTDTLANATRLIQFDYPLSDTLFAR